MASVPVVIPWSCLFDADKPKIVVPTAPAPQKSFAQVLNNVNNVCDIPLSQFPKPCVKGDSWSITISEAEYDLGIETCKHNLHGKIIWPKGATSIPVVALREKLMPIWKSLGRWGVTSLGKGFYEFSFSSLEDVRTVRSVGSWNLQPGLLKLFAWTTDFNPSIQQNTSAQVWVRFYGLSQEYWHLKILFAIASCIGSPICTDAITSKSTFDQRLRELMLIKTNVEKVASKRAGSNSKGTTFGDKLATSDDVTRNNNQHNSAGKSHNGEHITIENRFSGIADNIVDNNDIETEPTDQHSDDNSMQTVPKGTDEIISQDAEFVEATQSTNGEFCSAGKQTTPKQFFKQSWANLVDLEETERKQVEDQLQIEQYEAHIDAELLKEDKKNEAAFGFTLVTSRIKKKSNKQSSSGKSNFGTSSKNLLPNLWCLCASHLNPSIIDIDDQSVSFSLNYNNLSFGMSAIYASTCYIKRRLLWTKLQTLQSQNILPWCLLGDFNTIVGSHEYRGAHVPANIPMEDFLNWSDSNHLVHLPTKGAFFTWTNGRGGTAHTEKRLDKAICNHLWLDMCSSISCSTLIRNKSDHYPLLLDFANSEQRFVSQFKFLKMWSLHGDCKDLINASWNVPLYGSPMFILTKKLKRLKEALKVWNKNSFGNVHDHVKQAETRLQIIQDKMDSSGHTNTLMNMENQAKIDLDTTLNLQVMFWQEKSMINWHLEGDRNTSFFHRVTKIRNKTKILSSLRIGEIIITDPQVIASHVVDHFKSIFCINPSLQANNLINDVILSLLDEDVNHMLTLMPSDLEIHEAVFSMNKNSAPGPDGFGAFFFQSYWEIIKHDVSMAVMEFFSSGYLMPNMNANTLVLIPKSPDADTIDKYRPIAMTNFKFKIISKIIADRLARFMPNIVSKQQRGFIHANLSLSINGQHHGYFKCSRGVRQGDPLSPLLFCLAEDVLSRGISKLVVDGKVDLIKGARGSHVSSHIFYVDDIMIFCKGKISSLQALRDLFSTYAQASGQSISAEKSTIYVGSIPPPRLAQLVNYLGFKVGTLPFTYLGVPIFKGRAQLIKSVIFGMIMHTISIYSWLASLIKEVEKLIRNFLWSGDINKRKMVTVAWKKVCKPISEGGLGVRSLANLNLGAKLKLCWDLTQSNEDWAVLLKSRDSVDNYIGNDSWSLPPDFDIAFPTLRQIVSQITIPKSHSDDNLVWLHSTSGLLSFKDACLFMAPIGQQCQWSKRIWSTYIPPSKSLLIWRLIHAKLPTDDKLNLELACFIINLPLDLNVLDIWKICNRGWSPQCQKVITAAIIFSIDYIWLARNQARFSNNTVHWKSTVSSIIAKTQISGNSTNCTSTGNIRDFYILKAFNIKVNLLKAHDIIEVLWQPPILHWFKCNTDGAALGAPDQAAYGGIFRNSIGDCIGCFADKLGIEIAFFAELVAAMKAIEIAFTNG
ncbi:hypothetical protein TSUD_402140 [Trifolium subterraneum]|uniref:Reverse transcriptase domain-containing protein n=1 Tax=Trifolium subterraneum TaxID=3900 RepID=A0A2Z6PM18_TRISU|nr:hypothetical protein TSUD_402140 [Trifolium subterraneum]